jgi:hypothetical protein
MATIESVVLAYAIEALSVVPLSWRMPMEGRLWALSPAYKRLTIKQWRGKSNRNH